MREDLKFTFREMWAQLPAALVMFLLVVLEDVILEGGRLPPHLAPRAFVICTSFACVLAFLARRSVRLAHAAGTGVADAGLRPAGSAHEG